MRRKSKLHESSRQEGTSPLQLFAMSARTIPYLREEIGLHPHARLNNHIYGYLILAATFLFFVLSTYAAVVSKLMPDTGNALLDWIKHDSYYCFLVLAVIPVTFFIVYLNWLSFKFFRHNS